MTDWRDIGSAPKGYLEDKKHGGPPILLSGPLEYPPYYYIEVGRWYRTSWTTTWQTRHGEPTHWMPLPEPPTPDRAGRA